MYQIRSASRVYTNVLATKPEEYSDCTNVNIEENGSSNYKISGRLGNGSYGDVYKGFNTITNKYVAVKMMKPVRRDRIKREIKILRLLCGGKNIITLLDVAHFEDHNTTGLVFERIGSRNFRHIYLDLCEHDIRYYTYQILKALDYCHSRGIMHRDVKPHNMVVNDEYKIIKLIDFGLADFYRPGQKYPAQVGSRHYMAPEILVKYVYYNYSLDIWSLGCILTAMIFHKHPFFHGSNLSDQLIQIAKVLGTADLIKYLEMYEIQFDLKFANTVDTVERIDWELFKNVDNEHRINSYAYDFLDSILCYDHVARITAREALQHPYFSNLFDCENQDEDCGGCSATLTSAEMAGTSSAV